MTNITDANQPKMPSTSVTKTGDINSTVGPSTPPNVDDARKEAKLDSANQEFRQKFYGSKDETTARYRGGIWDNMFVKGLRADDDRNKIINELCAAATSTKNLSEEKIADLNAKMEKLISLSNECDNKLAELEKDPEKFLISEANFVKAHPELASKDKKTQHLEYILSINSIGKREVAIFIEERNKAGAKSGTKDKGDDKKPEEKDSANALSDIISKIDFTKLGIYSLIGKNIFDWQWARWTVVQDGANRHVGRDLVWTDSQEREVFRGDGKGAMRIHESCSFMDRLIVSNGMKPMEGSKTSDGKTIVLVKFGNVRIDDKTLSNTQAMNTKLAEDLKDFMTNPDRAGEEYYNILAMQTKGTSISMEPITLSMNRMDLAKALQGVSSL